MRWFSSVRAPARLLPAVVLLLVMAPIVAADSAHKTRQVRPIQLGTSGGNINHFEKAFCYGGTAGSLVQAGSVQFILSNNHVFARLNKAAIGEDIVQPALIDVSCRKLSDDVVADLSDFEPILFKTKSSVPLNTVDAAIAETRVGQVSTDGSILDIGTVSREVRQDTLDLGVKKSGRTTGLTTGSISAVDVTVDVNYGGGKVARFVDQFKITPGAFSAGGDSGSLVVEDVASTPRAVGLLFAGSDTSTIASPICYALNSFNVTMVGSVGTAGCPGVTSTTSAQQARARSAKERHEAALFRVAGVVGVGVGAGPAIEIYLAHDTASARRQVAEQLANAGVPFRVVATGEFRAL